MGRVIRGLVVVAALALGLLVPAAVRAVEVEWGTPTASATYGERVVFEQPATLPSDVKRLELLLEAPGAPGPGVIEVPAPGSGRVTLSNTVDLAEGHILPNTTFIARWRVVGDDGSEATGPAATVRYEDTRFDWQTREGDVVRVHWHEGGAAFGERALAIGDRAVAEIAALLGVTEDEPVDFFVYADEGEFREALGPGTRENVGGQANTEIRTLFALIPPGQIDDPWVDIVVPHELAHLVFDTAVDNPYHFPPRWLNEGLAVYLSEGYGGAARASVERAVADRALIPLQGLTGQFPTTRDRFALAYDESVAAVDFLIREHGQDALIQLVRSYATGLTDDEAFERAIGQDVEAFDAAWRADLRADDPTEYGPQPAAPGPLPPGWTTAEGSPGATFAPGPGTPGGPAAPLPGRGDDTMSALLPAIAGLVVGLAVVLLLVVITRRRRAAERAQVMTWAAWRDERTAPAARVDASSPVSVEPAAPAPVSVEPVERPTPSDPAQPSEPPTRSA